MQSGNVTLLNFSYVLGTVIEEKEKRNPGIWTLFGQLSLGLYEYSPTD